MAHSLPAVIEMAVEDPKVASLSSLESALNFYDDGIDPDALELVREEYIRRGGDSSWSGTDYIPPTYDF